VTFETVVDQKRTDFLFKKIRLRGIAPPRELRFGTFGFRETLGLNIRGAEGKHPCLQQEADKTAMGDLEEKHWTPTT
jgi:hypothetical protein